MFGNHDITHCNLDSCPVKDNCHRYLMHLDAVKNNLDYLTYVLHDGLTDVGDNGCNIYWPVK